MQNILVVTLFYFSMINSQIIIFDFKTNSDISDWQIVDDVVMGGKSNGNFLLNEDGNGLFYGSVSLKNNGGFSSVRHQFLSKNIKTATKIKVRLKGDGNSYQLRIKKNKSDYYSYVATFKTSNVWETIEVKLSEMQPRFRGQSLEMPNFCSETIEEIAFLIGNKKEQDFKLEIKKVFLD